MLTFDVQVSGGKVANALSNDPEALAEAFNELAQQASADNLASEVQEYMTEKERHDFRHWLREWADAIII